MEVSDIVVLAYAAVVLVAAIVAYIRTGSWGFPAMIVVAGIALAVLFNVPAGAS